jgi:hypothetical protein
MILDSSYLFHLMSGNHKAFAKGVELAASEETQWLPTPAVSEAYYGVETMRSDTTEAEMRNRLRPYPRIDVSGEIARVAGRLLAQADDRAGGNSGVDTNDAYIAAMAELLDETVLTRNVADFENLGVSVETY